MGAIMGLQDNLNLARAFRRVDSDRRDDAFPDIVGYRDYKRNLDDNLHALQNKIRDWGQYQTGMPLCIDLPKRGFSLRPGIVPLIDDRITYQAIADLFAQYFTSEENVFSNRSAGKEANQMFMLGVELWIAFQNKVEEYCNQYAYVVETDVTAYFDHINHRLMLSRITDLFGNSIEHKELESIKVILNRMWGRWNVGFIKNFGIPQINDASSFMANLYLDEIDKWLTSRNLLYLRYVDDIRIFVGSEPQARKALAELIVKMREMGLYIASGKTKIKKTVDVLGELTKGRNQIQDIESDIDSGNPERMTSAAQKMKDFFLQLVSEPQEFNDRLFRFCVNRFKRLYVTGVGLETNDRVIQEVIQRLDSMPESTDIFVDYLSLFTDNEFIQVSTLNFLESPYNIYPWQEMLLLELLVRLNLSSSNRLRANQYANSVIVSNKHPACKVKAYILLGKNGSYAERRDIRSRYNQEDRESVKRSIVVAIQEMKPDERDEFYKSISNESRGVGQIINFVQSLAKPTYDYYNPPSPYDVIPPDYDSDDLFDLGSEYFV
jgi:retron-type reverse transcriptase